MLAALRTATVLALAACAAPDGAPADAAPATQRVYVVNHGKHAGLALRAADVPPDWPARGDFPDAAFFEVGWGDRDYYMHPDPGLWLALKAALWPTPAALHIAAVDDALEHYFAALEIVELAVSAAGLPRIVEYVQRSHALDAAGRPIALGRGQYGRSRFYASRERFYFPRTCNAWVAGALRAAGLAVDPAAAITAEQLFAQLRPLARTRWNKNK
jgi:uncharacterized protein (TIGR02117 family)